MPVNEQEASLARMSDLLGLSAEAFVASERTLEKIRQTQQMLDLWDALDTSAARQSVLEFIRMLTPSQECTQTSAAVFHRSQC